jgi:hypothetical protein
MDQETMARLMALPPDSVQRQEILTSFGCYSMATVMMRIWQAPDEEKLLFEAKIEKILNDVATPG